MDGLTQDEGQALDEAGAAPGPPEREPEVDLGLQFGQLPPHVGAAITAEARESRIAAHKAELTTERDLEASEHFTTATRSWRVVREARMGHEARRAAIRADRNLSDEGAASREAESLEAYEKAITEGRERVVERPLHALAARFRNGTRPIMPDTLAQTALFFDKQIETSLPQSALERIALMLHDARDDTLSNEERRDKNLLLEHVAVPRLQRMELSPAKHQQPFVGAAGALARAVEQHLDVTFGRVRERLVHERVEQVRRDYDWLVASVDEYGSWDGDIMLAAVSSMATEEEE